MKALTGFALAAAVIASPVFAQTAPAEYVAKAGASDMYERESSKLVVETTRNDKIRSFAEMMIKDHTKSTADVTAAAKRGGLKPPPPQLEPEQTTMIAELRSAKGEARDRAYVTQQKMAHQKALALHQDYARAGTAEPLKAVAGQIAPVVQHHMEMLNAL